MWLVKQLWICVIENNTADNHQHTRLYQVTLYRVSSRQSYFSYYHNSISLECFTWFYMKQSFFLSADNCLRTNIHSIYYRGLHSMGIFLNTIHILMNSATHRLPTALPTCEEIAKYPNQSSCKSRLITAIATRAKVNNPTIAIQAAVWKIRVNKNYFICSTRFFLYISIAV